MKRNDPVKEYFAGEVKRMKPPPFPGDRIKEKRRLRWKDDLITFAAAAAILALVMTPGLYDNSLRHFEISRKYYEELRETVPRVVYDAALYMQGRIER